MSLVLVTGGAGFIGSHLTRGLLASGYQVRILDNLSPQIHGGVPAGLDWLAQPGIEFRRGSVTSHRELSDALNGADLVVHLAAETGTGQSMYEIAKYNDVNAQGTAVLLDILANTPQRSVRRVVLASSRSIYGEGAYVCRGCSPRIRVWPGSRPAEQLRAHRWEFPCPSCGQDMEAVPTHEDDKISPASIYAATKYAQEQLIAISCGSLGIGFANLRFQNVYGEGQSLQNPYTGILSIFSTRIRRGLHLPLFEDGQESRDFVHVEDVANAVIAALRSDVTGVAINVGSGIKTSVQDVAEKLSAAFGVAPDLRITSEFRLGDIRHNFADVGRLRDLLGYTPAIGLGDGLNRFAAWVGTQPLPEDRSQAANAELQARKLMG